jgi:hypothetical protein
MLRIVVLGGLALLAGGSWLAVDRLGWWALLVIPAVISLPFLLAGGWILRQALAIPFRAKGAVLRGATATVHSLEPAPAPGPGGEADGEDFEDDPGTPGRWLSLLATVEPREDGSGPFRLWEPAALRLADPDSDPMEGDGEEDGADVRRVEVEVDGTFRPDEGLKYGGTLRVRLLLRVPPGERRLAFRYYLETFGSVRIPA